MVSVRFLGALIICLGFASACDAEVTGTTGSGGAEATTATATTGSASGTTSASGSTVASSSMSSTSNGTGGSGGAPYMLAVGDLVPDFSLIDVNPASPTSNQPVSPRDYLQRVSGWYFGHAT